VRREELTARGQVKLTRHWSVGGAWRVDLNAKPLDENGAIIQDGKTTARTIRQDFIVGYEDECSTFGVTLRRDRTRTPNLEPDTAILLTFTLKSLVD
jgi:LPS-assembly protein